MDFVNSKVYSLLPVSPSPYSAIESVSLSGPCFVTFEATECLPALLLSSLGRIAFLRKCFWEHDSGVAMMQGVRGHSARIKARAAFFD